VAAEQAQAQAEMERDAAAAAQMTAEAERDAADQARMTAEAAQATANQARMDAEAAQAAADQARMDAEAAANLSDEERMAAEAAADAAQMAADAAAQAQADAEMAQADAETAQMAAEDRATAAQSVADAAVAAAATAAQNQLLAEQAQAAAEQAQADAEMAASQARMDADAAEAAQAAAEQAQADAEQAQADAEMALADANTALSNKEQELADANQALADANQALANANQALADANQALTDATKRAEDAEAALAALQVTLGYTQALGDYNAKKKVYDDAAVAYDTMAADVDEAEALVTAANAAKTAADALMAAAAGGSAGEAATAQAAVNAAQQAVSDAEAELAEAQMTAAAMPYAMAIMTQDATTSMAAGATAKRRGSAVTVTAFMAGADNTLGNEDDVEIAKDAAASSIGNGWFKASDVRDGDTGPMATVYTDIEDTMMKFSEVHNAASDQVTSVGATVTDGGVLTLNTGDDAAIALFEKFAMSSAFPGESRGNTTITYVEDDSTNPRKFSGSWDEVPGDFQCPASETTCSITANSKGVITAVVGTWTFTPDYLGADGTSLAGTDDANVATREDDLAEPNVRVADSDYLRFGWWTSMDEDDGSVSFRTFFGGQDAYSDTDFDALTGEAKYVGPAAGRYAAKTFNTNATINSIRHGEFTATATLTARFGGDDIAASKQDQIEGMVDNFKDENGNSMGGFSVTLGTIGTQALTGGEGAFSGTGQTDGEDGGVSGAVAGSPISSGDWTGQFFGNPAADATGNANTPGSVAGSFDAHSSHGHVAGAFGAIKQ